MTVSVQSLRNVAAFMKQQTGVDPLWLWSAADEIESLRTQLASAGKALEPFAAFADRFGETAREDGWQITQNPSGNGNLTMGDCRNARRTLKEA